MVDLMHCLANLLCFDIPLLYFYINLNSSIICCFSSGDIYLSLGISLLALSKCNSFKDFVETLVISSAILLPIKSPVASAVFLIAVLEAVFIGFVEDFLALSRHF